MTSQNSTGCIPLPQSTSKLIQTYLNGEARGHPGLILDKYAASWNKHDTSQRSGEEQKYVLEDVVRHTAAAYPDFAVHLETWKTCLKALGAKVFDARTRSPLTLHLSRASALENAGICLHHVHGFPYLPGSGLKGLARAYAQVHWSPAQDDPITAAKLLDDMFGPETQQENTEAGKIVFHDAWPASEDTLDIDIVNCHHSEYYSSKGKKVPGDWENPIPVFFLVIKKDVMFYFALSRRTGSVIPDSLLTQATEFLKGGLQYMGAGAKTTAGYGLFEAPDAPDLPRTTDYLPFRTCVTLVSPAFFAGALQQKKDCQLRAASLRGMLRWWWRTMHAGHVDGESLACMEAAIWGSASQGSAVTVDVTQRGEISAQCYSNDRSGKGVNYLSYGMDTKGHQRYFIDAGAQWELSFHVRSLVAPSEKNLSPRCIPAQDVLNQIQMALELLCTFGGIGSKSRKGFGSLQLEESHDTPTVQKRAIEVGRAFREKFFPTRDFPELHEALTASLSHCLEPLEITFTKEKNTIWLAIDQLGSAVQMFSKQLEQEEYKIALGLPRLDKHERHASPLHFHFENREGHFKVRALAFPCPSLPDLKTSKEVLQNILDFLEEHLGDSKKGLYQTTQQNQNLRGISKNTKRPYGESVQVQILAKRPKSGYDVREQGREQGTLTLGDPPDNLGVGKEYTVYIQDDASKPQYRWSLTTKAPTVSSKKK